MVELLEGIGHNIRHLRGERGWNQAELGFHADTSPSIISLIENGKRNPSTATLAKIAGALGVEVVELFPKASGRSSREPTLFNGLEAERRRDVYLPWLEFARRYADRWHEKARKGGLTRSEILEWQATIRDLAPLIGRLREEEERAVPPERRDALGDDLIMWQVTSQLLSPLEEILSTQEAFNETELAQLRRERERLQDLGKAANG